MMRKELAEPVGTNTSHSHKSGGKIKLCPLSVQNYFPPSSFRMKQTSECLPEAGQQRETHPITPASSHPPVVTLRCRGFWRHTFYICLLTEKWKSLNQNTEWCKLPSMHLSQKAGADSHPQLDGWKGSRLGNFSWSSLRVVFASQGRVWLQQQGRTCLYSNSSSLQWFPG